MYIYIYLYNLFGEFINLQNFKNVSVVVFYSSHFILVLYHENIKLLNLITYILLHIHYIYKTYRALV